MVSDITLLKELPDFIRDSIAAYVGCISGALIKDEYIKVIEEAGFQKIEIVGEDVFPVEYMVNDPTAGAIIDKLSLPMEKVMDVASSVVSIKVQGVKPS